MGHYAFLIVAGFIVAGSMLSIGMRKDTRDAAQETARVMFKEEAREAALTGMNLTLRRIVLDEGEWSGAASYELPERDYKLARFQTWITPIGVDTLDITSRGTKDYLNRRGEFVDTTHTVDVRIIRTQLAGGIPPAFEAAIMTDSDMTIRGTFDVTSYDGVNNANVHANGILDGKGNQYHVDGYGSYTTGESVTNPEDHFEPPLYEGSGSTVAYTDSVPFPELDLPVLKADAMAGGYYSDVDVNLDVGSIMYDDFGDWAAALHPSGDPEVGRIPEKPFIFYSDLGIDISGSKTLGGWGAFVSVESIRINSSTQIHGLISTNEEGLPVTQMGIFTAGDLTVNGIADITATLYSGGYTLFDGTATITGGAILKEVAMFTGTFNLIWAGFNEGFTQYFGGTVDVFGPTIAAWAEW